ITKLTREDCREFIEKRLFEPVSLPGRKLDTAVGWVGVELESFPYRIAKQSAKGAIPVPLYGGPESLMNSLLRVCQPHGCKLSFWENSGEVKKIEFPDGDRLLFEPGGQVEISTTPCDNMHSLKSHLDSKQALLQQLTVEHSIHFLQAGTHPWFTVEEIGNQLKEPRYLALEKYFDDISPYGKQMMLQTGSLHINLDLGKDETIRVKRILAANLLVPLVTALFGNSASIGGVAPKYKSHRSFLWQHLDEKRTGILFLNKTSGSFTKDDLVDEYLEFALNAPLVFIRKLGNHALPRDFTMQYWLNNAIDGEHPDLSDFENHLSLLFPEVRLKGYLEMRSVDAPPPGYELVPVIFYAGMLYNDETLDKALDLLIPQAPTISSGFKEAMMGLTSDHMFDISKKLVRLAIDGYAALHPEFRGEIYSDQLIDFFQEFTLNRKSFADIPFNKSLSNS
ncbi:MAG TPA: glutamate-cysteine ligase family protein, partial [Saprospiraceae bacterium]|nr:glutamate-cysteine ligase family protein [Saprospiraceae bacterium]